MLRCFKCGKAKPGTKKWQGTYYACPDASCSGRAIPVDKNLIPVTEKLLSMGYCVTAAEDSMTLLSAVSMEIAIIHIELGKRYDPAVFPALPDGWLFHTYADTGDTSRIILSEQYPTYGVAPPKGVLLSIVKELYDYLCELEEKHAPQIFKLAGWL